MSFRTRCGAMACAVLIILALAAASAFWFFSRTTSPFARRAPHPRMHMSNS
jgi:hypothetical protein